mmetsp:Transcript_17440/g.52311  ORF Transcript_17440/g.52311 Transcript_17440/m.52311 type:complete len:225 (-) Transcript_17440:157-831(-)
MASSSRSRRWRSVQCMRPPLARRCDAGGRCAAKLRRSLDGAASPTAAHCAWVGTPENTSSSMDVVVAGPSVRLRGSWCIVGWRLNPLQLRAATGVCGYSPALRARSRMLPWLRCISMLAAIAPPPVPSSLIVCREWKEPAGGVPAKSAPVPRHCGGTCMCSSGTELPAKRASAARFWPLAGCGVTRTLYSVEPDNALEPSSADPWRGPSGCCCCCCTWRRNSCC